MKAIVSTSAHAADRAVDMPGRPGSLDGRWRTLHIPGAVGGATSMIVVYERVHLVIRLGGITSIVISERGSASARGEDVELVASGVGQARPRDVALAKVDVGGAEFSQPGHLHRLIVTGVVPEVEMD